MLIRRIFVGIQVGLFLLAQPGLLQAPVPLEMHVGSPTTNAAGRQSFPLRLSNSGLDPIRAYVLRLEFFDPQSNKSLVVATHTIIAGLGNPKLGKKDYATREMWDDTFMSPLAATTKANYTITVDYVRTESAQGSRNWGPDRDHLSRKVEGVMEAYKTERKRLKQILETQGVDALRDDLNAP